MARRSASMNSTRLSVILLVIIAHLTTVTGSGQITVAAESTTPSSDNSVTTMDDSSAIHRIQGPSHVF